MILLDNLNNIYIGGYTSSFGVGGTDIFILKYKGWGIVENMVDNIGNNTKNKIFNAEDPKYFIIFFLLILSSLGISFLLIHFTFFLFFYLNTFRRICF